MKIDNSRFGPGKKFPGSAVLHVPANSGVALTKECASLAKNGWAFVCPFLAVEHNGRFTGYRWQPWSPLRSGPVMTREQDQWRAVWPAGTRVAAMEETRSLPELVRAYRRIQPLPDVPGKTVCDRVRRTIFLDLWLADGRITHTYHDVIRLLKELENTHLAEGTLLYLPGWFAPYDQKYPLYEPAEELGGKQVFRRMVALAGKIGSVIMPHLNFWGYDPRLDPLMDRSVVQARDHSGNLAHWPKFCNLFMGNEISYMRISHPDWQKLFFRYFDALVGDYGLEAVFLDQMGNVLEDPACDFQSATTALLRRIHASFPHLLIGGEVLSEALTDHVGLIQSIWLNDVHEQSWSPVIKHLYAGKVRFLPHLFLAAAKPCRYVVTNYQWFVERGTEAAFKHYQSFNRRLGGIPSVRIDYNRFGIDAESRAVLKTR